MLIDCHLHLFPDKLAPGTLARLTQVFGSDPHGDATLSGTLDLLAGSGADLGVALHIATNPRSQHNVNDFALACQEQSGGRLISFGSVHPDAPDAIEELHRIASMGLHGVKLHADYQGFLFQDSRCYPIYEEIAALGLPVTIHTGFDPLSPDFFHAPAAAVAQVASDFPKLRIIAAHMGGMGFGAEEDERLFRLENVWFDTAVLPACYKGREGLLVEHLRRRGIDHVLFGTDCPWETVANTRALLERCGLTAGELDRIYYKNAQELLQLDGNLTTKRN